MQILTSVGVGILLFLCLYLGFRTGLRLGIQTAKGQIPLKVNLNPVAAVQKAVEGKQQDAVTSELLKGWKNMQDYDGFLPEEKR